MAEIYNDSKTFVDKPLINPVDQVLFNFDVFMQVIERLPWIVTFFMGSNLLIPR